MCNGIGLLIEFIIVSGLVDPYAPYDYRRVVPVLLDHLAAVLYRLFLPFVIADVLPSWHLGYDKEAFFVTLVDEMMRLGIVRGADNVDAQFLFQDLCIKALDVLRHRIACIRIALMAV